MPYGLNNRYLSLTVLDAGTSKIQAPADLVSGENPLLDGHFLAVSQRGEGAREFSGVSQIPFMRALLS